MLKTARIATGAARAEGRQPSHDGEFITIIYNTSDPSAIIAEHNAGTFCLDEMAYPPEGLDEEQEAAYRAEWGAAQTEAYEAARKDSGEPLVRCGSDAREEIVELGWATVANFDGDHYCGGSAPMSKTTYSVITRDPNSWNASTGIHEQLANCGHLHKSVATAQHCYDQLTRRLEDGSWSATWYYARIEDNATHQAVDL